MLLALAVAGCVANQTPAEALRESCADQVAHARECGGEVLGTEFEQAAEAQCRRYEQATAGEGDDCRLAAAGIFDCITELSCEEAYIIEGAPKAICPEAAQAAASTCPELFGICRSMGMSSTVPPCFVIWQGCADENEYRIDCDAEACTCSQNGAAGVQFESMDCEALVADPEPFVSTQCGWPAVWSLQDDAGL